MEADGRRDDEGGGQRPGDGGGQRPGDGGGQRPGGGHRRTHPYDSRPPDPAALFTVLDGMRRMAPRELEGQITNLIREFLLTLRSLIDWYLERLDRPREEPRVEDIPID